jgi:hypothetical protein
MRKRYLWQSTKMKDSTNTVQQVLPEKKDTPSCAWYSSINKLPLTRFIDAIVDNNLSALIISGRPTDIELDLAWQDIQLEYSDALGDGEAKLQANLTRQISILQITLQQIEMLIEVLGEVYYEDFSVKLNGLLKTNFVFNPKEPETYSKNLKACFSRSRGIKIDLHIKQEQLKGISGKQTDSNFKYTREYFQSMLITISDHAKYQIMDNITVFEFCNRIKRFNDYCEALTARK